MPTFHPIIFVHGWGGIADFARDFNDSDERDPYVGWNQGHRYNDPDGWIKFRDSQPNFEGLVMRLLKDYNYYDASNDMELAEFKRFLGQETPDANKESASNSMRAAAIEKTVWIFRYYEYNAEHLQLKPEIEREIKKELKKRGYSGDYAGVARYAGLLALEICRITCPACRSIKDWNKTEGLGLEKVALVGHSMGGLIARFALQYDLFGIADKVARFMTLATPHGGARFAAPAKILRWLPGMRNDDVMFLLPDWVKRHLQGQKPKRLGGLSKDSVFSLVGTRHEGYAPIARHLPRTDGIVHQDEAFLENFPYAYVYNTHSGEHGIRENHDGYQSLRRFLFGDLRVQLRLKAIDLLHDSNFSKQDKFFFHFFVKPRGINAHLNEISERGENQPRPRTISQLKSDIKSFIVFDGFADSAAIMEPGQRDITGVDPAQADISHLQLEYHAFLFDQRVGGKIVGGGMQMIPLIDKYVITQEDQSFRFELEVHVKQRK